eukprot:CAMPEP_0171387724 /NCGR_PEP_ID=MMETSP0879-20121228/40145_1 /TAXON_ID=67004 /ORGANISM="Thalassiosira weissflogii, Strain CCMP1336" /LENGTH=778 /DNA_ID=CAMNT_0011900055 /DNA_START=282 /DNA_END=2615 /DNA_ORIENTATION=+
MNPFDFGDDTLRRIVQAKEKDGNDSYSASSAITTIYDERDYSHEEGIFRRRSCRPHQKTSRQQLSPRDRAHHSCSPHKHIATHKDTAMQINDNLGSLSFNQDQGQSKSRHHYNRPDYSQSLPNSPSILKSPSVDTASIVRKATFPFKPAADLEIFQAQTIQQSRSDVNETLISPSFENRHSILNNGIREMNHVSYSPPRRVASFPCETSQQYAPSPVETNDQPSLLQIGGSSQSFYLNDSLQFSLQNRLKLENPNLRTREEERYAGGSNDGDEPTSLFPVCIDLPVDKNCWWIKDFDFSDKTSTIVYDQDDQVEVMQSLEPSVAQTNEQNDNLQNARMSTAPMTVVDQRTSLSTVTRKDAGTTVVQAEEKRQRFKLGLLDSFVETFSSEAGPCVSDIQDAIDSGIVAISEVGTDFDNDDLAAEDVFIPSEWFVEAKDQNSVENNGFKRDNSYKANPVCVSETSNESNTDNDKSSSYDAFNQVRRTTVAITGATLVTTGIALIPFPVVPGALVAYGGLMVLATEFEGAKKALKVVRGPLEKILADEVDSDEENDNRDTGESSSWQQTISFLPSINKLFVQDIDDDFMELMKMGKSNSFHFIQEKSDYDGVRRYSKNDELKKSQKDSKSAEARARKNAMKRWMRKFLKLESDVDSSQIDINGIDDDAMINKNGKDGTVTGSKEKRTTNKMILRFDSNCSVITSCGEEVDENGVHSDRLQVDEDGGTLYSFRNTTGSDGVNKSFSRSDSLKIQKENPGCILFCRWNSDSNNIMWKGKWERE